MAGSLTHRPLGPVVARPGSTASLVTGDWRSERPVIDLKACIHCLRCWVYCPDVAIIVEEGRVRGVDDVHCKGCAICAAVCPPKVAAIRMIPEPAEDGQAEVRTA